MITLFLRDWATNIEINANYLGQLIKIVRFISFEPTSLTSLENIGIIP